MDYLTSSVCMKKGDEIQVHCSCDGEFILQVMGEVGEAMRFLFVFYDQEMKQKFTLSFLTMQGARN